MQALATCVLVLAIQTASYLYGYGSHSIRQKLPFRARVVCAAALKSDNKGDGEGTYIPSIGIESFIYSLGLSRPLLGNEYELGFDHFPGLRRAAETGTWRPRSSSMPMKPLSLSDLAEWQAAAQNDDDVDNEVISPEGEEEQEVLTMQEALSFTKMKASNPIMESDVEASLNRFRKIVGGLEKYRITNPGMVADHYRDMIRTCLAAEETWGAAASALNYAGFDIKANVRIVDVEGAQQIPVLQTESVSSQAAVKLLDLEFTSRDISEDAAKEMTKSLEDTYDQRFFGQIDTDREKVQDMVLYILRVCVRAVLTRDNTPFIVVDAPLHGAAGRDSLQQWMPSLSSIKAVLCMDFNVLSEEEEGDVVRFFVADREGRV